ncbi:MAG: acyl-CoA dehydratase activase-related protein, partial [Chloroflexota bacterium]
MPEEACFFEALGAAVYGLQNEVTIYKNEKIFLATESLFTFHKPLSLYNEMVTFGTSEIHPAKANDEYILGLDVGSTTTKGVLINSLTNNIVASEYLYTHGNPIEASKNVFTSLQKQISVPIRIIGLGVTGSGRHITALHTGTKSVINEITAHAKASVFFDPEVDTIFEIGGQDAKYTLIYNGVPADYAMNEACSAGTGSFIQEAAWETLNINLYDIEAAALSSKKPLNFRDQCAALIGSDIKSALQENHSQEDILGGLVYSICLNYINRVKGKREVGKKIFMQGGVCYNKAIPIAMAAVTGKAIVIPPFPGLMGAFGTALKLKEQIDNGLTPKSDFNLTDIIKLEFETGKSFICKDKANGCDRKCEINTFKINGKITAFGGACNKYYDAFIHTQADWQKNDYVKLRMNKIYEPDLLPIPGAKTIGINQSFTINRLFPLYKSFFTSLGFNIHLSDCVEQAGFDNQHSSFCFPVEISHGLFYNLISKNPDYIFMPEVYEMHVPGCENDEKDSSATCVFVSKEINYLSQAFDFDEERIIHPYLNFAKGYLSQQDIFIKIAQKLGIKDKEYIRKVFRQSVDHQLKIEREMLDSGKSILDDLRTNQDEIAIVIVGRDYNAFSDFANKGIPQKFASLGYKVIPYDLIDSSKEEIINYQSWEAGKRILRAAQSIRKNPQLFPVYISNYSCGPDSFLVPIFRRIMGNKPSLTLELDQHTADAGINTRIDAFIDVVKNFRSMSKQRVILNGEDFHAAEIINKGISSVFKDSEGNELDLKDPRVQIIVPAIGDMAAALFAASLKSLGYNAIALGEMDPLILESGHKYTSGKECLPIILLTGSLMTFIQQHKMNGERLAFMNIGGTSACRVAQYPGFLTELVHTEKIKNVAMFTLISQEGYIGLSQGFLKRSMDAIILNDILEDVRSGILANAIDCEKGLEVFYSEFNQLVEIFSNDYGNLLKGLKKFSSNISAKVPHKIPVTESRYIALTGEIFIRHNQFAHKWLNHYFGKRGFVLKDAYISEWVKYLDYAWRKGVDRPKFTFIEAISRLIREQ